MCSCHSIPVCCVMFSGVKLSMKSFILSLFTHFTPIKDFLDVYNLERPGQTQNT